MKITLQQKLWRKVVGFCIVSGDGDHSILIQSDWDHTKAASTFGWVPCPCRHTDGTIRCEHRTPAEMIEEAYEFCEENVGKTVEDPGYF